MLRALLCIFCLVLSGCTQLQFLPYLDQALTLKEFGAEKASQHKMVNDINARYDQLAAAVSSGDISKFKTEEDIVKAYGPALLISDVDIDGKSLKRSLYRYAVIRQAKDKIYLYYDNQGNLVKWESQPLPF